MNKRITELWTKAAESTAAYPTGQNNSWETQVNFMEKFAELIVLEMCGMMEQCQDDCDTGDASETNWGYISQLQDWIDRFKEHFGVEE